jgi:hypothetical protein
VRIENASPVRELALDVKNASPGRSQRRKHERRLDFEPAPQMKTPAHSGPALIPV